MKTVYEECGTLIAEIDIRLPSFGLETQRTEVVHLRQRLFAIRTKIENRNHPKKMAKVCVPLLLYGNGDKKDLMTVLQEYQTRATMCGNQMVEQVLSRVSKDGITAEVVDALLSPIIRGLDTLATVKEELTQLGESISTRINEGLHTLGNVERGTDRANAGISSILDEITSLRENVRAIQSSLPALRGFVDENKPEMKHLELDNGNMLEYVEDVKEGGGCLSDREIWEAFWDIAETYKIFGIRIINPFQVKMDRRRQIYQDIYNTRFTASGILGGAISIERFMAHLTIAEETEEKLKDLGPFGIWNCLGLSTLILLVH